ncbi:MAG: hypothetical protein K1X49_05070 [Saprospiraceae bacterium]|nr:hypothetical protein [Saprospiraceae bacterium]
MEAEIHFGSGLMSLLQIRQEEPNIGHLCESYPRDVTAAFAKPISLVYLNL